MRLKEKIVDLDKAAKLRGQWLKSGLAVGFTNGCFDILHSGHVLYLEEAKEKVDKLIVGLNSDRSTKALKGEHRPICDEQSRALVLAALDSVDMVVIFDESTPLHLIKTLEPNVLMKGGDYEIATIVGATEVQRNGGQVIVIPFVEGQSTTSIEQRILDLHA